MDVDVSLAGWKIECCQPPPGEGDDVSWPLLWVDDLTRGRVLTVRLVEQTYQRTTGAYAPVPGDFVLRQ